MMCQGENRCTNIVQVDGSLPAIARMDEHRGVIDKVEVWHVMTAEISYAYK